MDTCTQIINKLFPDHLCLEIDSKTTKEIEIILKNKYSNVTGEKTAYINLLCYYLLVQEQEKMEAEDNLSNNPDKLQERFKPKEKLFYTWEFVNGFDIEINGKKLIFIPSEDDDFDGFSVPQEWVDIETWAGVYYVPIQVDLEAQYIHFWGFISHRRLKEKAEYDKNYRMYDLDARWLIDDFNLLWEAVAICNDEVGDLVSLDKLSPTEADKLIAQLSEASNYSPRLDVEFEKWGALLNSESSLEKLYERRLNHRSLGLPKNLITRPAAEGTPKGARSEGSHQINDLKEDFPKRSHVDNLGYWFINNFGHTWVALEELLSPEQLKLAPVVRPTLLKTKQDFDTAVREMRVSRSSMNKSVKDLDPENVSRYSDEQYLVYLLENAKSESERWMAANYLWIFFPERSKSVIRRVISLELDNYQLALMIALFKKADGNFSVLSRVYPMGAETLPPGLSLQGLDENGNLIPNATTVSSQGEGGDPYIQLIFLAEEGDRLNLRLNLGNSTLTKQFSFGE